MCTVRHCGDNVAATGGCLGRGWFYTVLIVLSGGGGMAADRLVKNKGMNWRRERIERTSNAKPKHGDGETKREP